MIKDRCQFDVIWVPKVWGSVYKLLLNTNYIIILLLHITFQEKKKASHKISLFLWFFLLSNWYWNDINLASERWYQFDVIAMLTVWCSKCTNYFSTKSMSLLFTYTPNLKKRKYFHRVNHVFYNSYCYPIDVDMPSIWCKRRVNLMSFECPRYEVVCINYFSTQIISLFCCYTLHFKKRKRLHTKYHYFYDFFLAIIDIEMTSIWRQKDDINLMSFQCWQYDVVCTNYFSTQKCHCIYLHTVWKKENVFIGVNHVFYNSYWYLIDVDKPTCH